MILTVYQESMCDDRKKTKICVYLADVGLAVEAEGHERRLTTKLFRTNSELLNREQGLTQSTNFERTYYG